MTPRPYFYAPLNGSREFWRALGFVIVAACIALAAWVVFVGFPS